mmetsp:Transcript_23956/g.55887  ORF Transcript_23956/g.55887 Transcript_23956/m.55887 type:complete len:98 (+) Transcript_23956:1066-1359(+)
MMLHEVSSVVFSWVSGRAAVSRSRILSLAVLENTRNLIEMIPYFGKRFRLYPAACCFGLLVTGFPLRLAWRWNSVMLGLAMIDEALFELVVQDGKKT